MMRDEKRTSEYKQSVGPWGRGRGQGQGSLEGSGEPLGSDLRPITQDEAEKMPIIAPKKMANGAKRIRGTAIAPRTYGLGMRLTHGLNIQ